MTIYVNNTIPERIKRLASSRNLSMADLSNWLLLYALNELENGRIEPPTKEVRRIVDISK
ncbi:MAG: hypothetical protein AAF490_21925 [Chloroflexota bacterium]